MDRGGGCRSRYGVSPGTGPGRPFLPASSEVEGSPRTHSARVRRDHLALVTAARVGSGAVSTRGSGAGKLVPRVSEAPCSCGVRVCELSASPTARRRQGDVVLELDRPRPMRTRPAGHELAAARREHPTDALRAALDDADAAGRGGE